MATIDLRRVLGGSNFDQNPRLVTIQKTVDFAEYTAGSGDTVKLFDLPAGFVRTDCDAILLTAEGGAGTVDIGITGSIDTFLDGGDVNGTPNVILAKGTNGTAAHTLFASATTVILTANAALDAAKILVVVTGYMTDVRA